MKNIEDIYELSPMQQGMLFHTLYAPESGVYFEQRSCTLHGHLNSSAFKQAWQQVVARHSVLRTSFHWEELDKPLQVVNKTVELPWVEYDWLSLTATEQEHKLQAFLDAERQVLKLDQAPLMRCALIKLRKDSYQFVWSHHHLLMDGWCNAIILKEVLSFYEALVQGKNLYLKPARPYRNYIDWLQQQNISQAEVFWRRELRGFTAPTPLEVDRRIGEASSTDEQHLQLSATVTTALQSLAQQHHLTLNTLVQGAWAVLLSRYSGETDVLFGATVSGRPPSLLGVESMVGLFINTLPVRVQIPPETELIPWLQQLQAQQIEREEYSYSSLLDIQGWSDVPRGTPLFDSLIVFENYPVSIDAALQEWSSSLEISNRRGFEKTHYPLTVVAIPGSEFSVTIQYDCGRFNAATIERMLGHFQNLIEGIVANSSQRLVDLPLLTQQERHQLLVEWNATNVDILQDVCIHQLFEIQVEQTPEAIAVVFADKQLTYRELNRRANRLAHHLRNLGVGPDVFVGICMERSLEMVVGLLGILKAGGAYVPLDPLYPQERLAFMLESAQAKVLLTQKLLVEKLFETQTHIICLDADWESIATSEENPVSGVKPENLAYVIYTSGSTGRPKGVMIQHRSLVNCTKAASVAYEIEKCDRILQFASISFDASAEEIYPCLTRGATLVLRTDFMLDTVSVFLQKCQDWEITVLVLPTAYWHELTVRLNGQPIGNAPAARHRKLNQTNAFPPSLRIVIFGGEKALPERLSMWHKQVGQRVRLVNGYGPTEATIVSTVCDLAAEDQTEFNGPPIGNAPAAAISKLNTRQLPIGRPMRNTQTYVLDRYLQPVPIGVRGELHISSVGLARGYLNHPELTAEKFIPNPFAPGARLYKTGDSARYLEDGNIEYLDRIDRQVKVRGFRIELGEIEAVLSQYPGVQEAVVMLREEQRSEQRLVAYIVPKPEQAIAVPQMRSFLQQKLPDYMLPLVVVLEALPLMPNGKLNRQALKEADVAQLQLEYSVAPRTPIEEVVAGIWAAVLDLKQVGIDDNFFALGGHSLLATRVISRLREVFSVDLPLRRLFEKPTVAELAKEVEAATQIGLGREAPSIQRLAQSELPLSFAQQRLWFLAELEPDSPFYNIAAAVRLQGPLHVGVLKQSLKEIICRHEVLRTSFQTIQGNPVQVIRSEPLLNWTTIDLSELPATQQESQARQLALFEAQQPLDLDTSPMRVKLLRLGEQEHAALFTMHHIVSDGWSLGVLVRELSVLYQAFLTGQPSPLLELPIQYADFATWQRQWLQGDILQAQLDYWRQHLDGAPDMLELPTDRRRPAVSTFRGATCTFNLSQDLSWALKDLSQQEGSTLFMTLLAGFLTLLYRYTGSEDIVVGSAIANRNRAEIEGLIGFFVNTLALRTNLAGNPGFQELLSRVREVALGAYAHQDLPFEQLVEELQPQRSLSHMPLFQVMFVLQNAPLTAIELSGLTWSSLEIHSGTAKFDLTLSLAETPAGLVGSFEYNTDLFDADTIQRMAGHYQNLLEAIVYDPQQKLSDLPLLTKAEQQQLLFEWNDTQTEYPRQTCIHQLFEAQVEQTTDAIALVFEDQQLTYQELNIRANKVAHYLRSCGVGPEVLVGICVERSLEMLVGLLGILKAGGAYVPLDPAYPKERLAFMMSDAQMPVLLTQKRLVEALPTHRAKVICLDADWEVIDRESQEQPLGGTQSESLAYIMYTSGSTGIPKGVSTPHRGVVRLVKENNYANLTAEEIFLQAAPISFDASTFEIWGSLLNGARLVILPVIQPSLEQLGQAIEQYNVTTLWLTAGLFHLMVDEQLKSLKNLRQLLAGGDVLSGTHVQKFLDASKNCRLINGYGPTESTTFACCYLVDASQFNGSLPIGRPIANTKVYVLDRYLQPVPIGVPGELHVGGNGLARSYLNRPELTAERFIPNPFASTQQQEDRLYKTGDIVRYLSDGNIDYLGRQDAQVKIRGFRIELGEVEIVLNQHPEVRESVVVAQTDQQGHKRLVAYVVPSVSPASPTLFPNLRHFLIEKLPDYMVPSVFVQLEALPLTLNGKVDRQALPAPDIARPEKEFLAPLSPIEVKLVEIWAEVLHVQQVGIHDNFFELGGDSILAIQIVSRANQVGLQLTPKQIFQHQSIAELATVAGTTDAIQAEQGLVTGPLPLTPIQHWFFEQNLPELHHFNQSVLLEVRQVLDLALLEQALRQLLLHHDALRLRFAMLKTGLRQVNANPNCIVPLTHIDLSALSVLEQGAVLMATATELQASLNLSSGPLVRVAFFNLGAQQPNRLLIIIHHLAVDGISWRILLSDLQIAYTQLSQGKAVVLPPKTTSFQQWSYRLQEYAHSAALQQEWGYWLADSRKLVSSLPVDYPAGDNTVASTDIVSVAISSEHTQALLKEVPKAYNTQINDVLLTALVQALAHWTGEHSALVDIEGHGREEIFDDVNLSRTVGWFTTIFPVLLDLKAAFVPEDALKIVKEQLRSIPKQGIGYGMLRYFNVNQEISEALKTMPQAEICFNYLGQFDQVLSESSLFKIDREFSSPTRSSRGERCYLLEINGLVTDERLQMEWTYSKNVYRKATVESLAQTFVQVLLQLIAHCQSPEVGGYTPSDFSLAQLDQETLNEVLGRVEF